MVYSVSHLNEISLDTVRKKAEQLQSSCLSRFETAASRSKGATVIRGAITPYRIWSQETEKRRTVSFICNHTKHEQDLHVMSQDWL